ncbi:LacI family DNA-binding transcriptional regulator [Alteribacillus sp. JSM 102045]|uniref:LacI family DNA-binding transcriptional regulator n=1 Tax=Alteribacillus sp. JSM 102045 TaxID=1562101 RepID=UPI0035C20FC4
MVSSKDVAKRAGVSQSTVSRVLNNSHRVSRDNIEKVTKAMKELNYRPNSIARSLVSKQTKTLALISGPLHNPFFVETTTSIVNYANEKGYKINVFFENMGNNMTVYESVLSMQLDGLILSSIFMDDPIYEELQSLNIPFVMFNRKHNKGGSFVEIDNEKAGKMAADHLLDLGHEKIGYIGGPLYTSTFYGRYIGFSEQIEKRAALDHALIHETDTSEKAIQEAVLNMMGRKHKPTAIFAATDAIAIFAIDTLKELGYSIPDDISICGMDNVRMARHHSFELTTIGHQTDKNLGRLGIEHLIEMVEGENDPKEQIQITMDPVLYTRKTTCKV